MCSYIDKAKFSRLSTCKYADFYPVLTLFPDSFYNTWIYVLICLDNICIRWGNWGKMCNCYLMRWFVIGHYVCQHSLDIVMVWPRTEEYLLCQKFLGQFCTQDTISINHIFCCKSVLCHSDKKRRGVKVIISYSCIQTLFITSTNFHRKVTIRNPSPELTLALVFQSRMWQY